MQPLPKRTASDFAAIALVVLLAVSLVGAFVSTEIFLGGAVSALACAGYMLFGKSSRESRECAEVLYRRLKKNWQALRAKTRTIDIQHRQQLAEFEISAKELNQEKVNYLAEGDDAGARDRQEPAHAARRISSQPVDPRQRQADPGHDAVASDAARVVRRRIGVRRRADEALRHSDDRRCDGRSTW